MRVCKKVLRRVTHAHGVCLGRSASGSGGWGGGSEEGSWSCIPTTFLQESRIPLSVHASILHSQFPWIPLPESSQIPKLVWFLLKSQPACISLQRIWWVVKGPPKNESLRKFYPGLGISQNLLMGLGVSDFVSVNHKYAFLLSRYTFSSRARILRCQSRHLYESRIYHSPPLICSEREDVFKHCYEGK